MLMYYVGRMITTGQLVHNLQIIFHDGLRTGQNQLSRHWHLLFDKPLKRPVATMCPAPRESFKCTLGTYPICVHHRTQQEQLHVDVSRIDRYMNHGLLVVHNCT
jgi:hypothetical protein